MRNFNRDRKFGRKDSRQSYGDSKRFSRDSGRPERRDFRKGENFESKSPDQYKKEFGIINEKLDKILEALGK